MTEALKLLLSYGRSQELFQDFLGKLCLHSSFSSKALRADAVEQRFHLVKKDVQRYLNRLEVSLATNNS